MPSAEIMRTKGKPLSWHNFAATAVYIHVHRMQRKKKGGCVSRKVMP